MDIASINNDQLLTTDLKMALPFSIISDKDDGDISLVITKIFRVLPGKRIVALAEYGGCDIVIKIFIGKKYDRDAKRELQGIKAISSAEVLTPEFLWRSELKQGIGTILAFEYIENSVNLKQLWEQSSSKETKLNLLNETLKVLASLHNKGVQQEDIHLDNFVVAKDVIYTIDGGSVDLSGLDKILSLDKSLDNLAVFFAQFPIVNDQLITEVFSTYIVLRSEKVSQDLTELLKKKIYKERRKRKKYYLAKTLRECSRFVCRSSVKEFMVCERAYFSEEIEKILYNPDGVMNLAIERGQVLKNGNSATVVLVHTSEGPIVVKRYNRKSFWRGFRRLFKQSRARTSWTNAHQLDLLGIPAVKPIAMIEKKRGPLVTKAYFICDYIEGTNADLFFSTADDLLISKYRDKLVVLLCTLKQAMISHGDLKASNFRVSSQGIQLLDLDAMKEYKNPKLFHRVFRKDIRRFMQNWNPQTELHSKFELAVESMVDQGDNLRY